MTQEWWRTGVQLGNDAEKGIDIAREFSDVDGGDILHAD